MEVYTPQKHGNRVLGEILAISVATAIPLEHLLATDIAKGYTHIYLNVRTLYRNFHGSFEKENVPTLTKYVDLFVTEILLIHSIISESVKGNLQPVYYMPTSKSLPVIMPWAKLKKESTQRQKNYESLEKMTIVKTLAKLDKNFVLIIDTLLKGQNASALIITHLPLDLLSYSSFRKLTLLESHTGALKSKVEWIVKLSKNSHYRNIPFNILSIQVLGDRNTQLGSMGIKLSNELLALAEKHHWSAITSLEKVKSDIRVMANKETAAFLLKLASVTLV